jgi:hypothetical protein
VRGVPDDGKIVIARPEDAVRFVEVAPAFGMRVFTLPGIPEGKAYVVDIDAIYRLREEPTR